MSNTPNLELPYIQPAQAQKHVTHNEAIRKLDALVHIGIVSRTLSQPPQTAGEGARYIVGVGAIESWQDQSGNVAAFQDGGWNFYEPQTGWVAWVEDEALLVVHTGGNWQAVVADTPQLSELGINTDADGTNRLAVKSDAILLSHDDVTPGTGDMRLVVNKSAEQSSASVLFQSEWQARAEFGLPGSDDFQIKVSPDGMNWKNALTINATTGSIIHEPNQTHTFQHGPDFAGMALIPASGDPSDPQDGDVWYNSDIDKFRKRQAGVTTDLDTTGGGSSGGGSADPGGADKEIQFNNNGSLAGAQGLIYDYLQESLSVGGSIALPQTTDGQTGVMTQQNQRLLHTYGSSNVFLGRNAGNFTLTGVNMMGLGHNTLSRVTSGIGNMAIGAFTLDAVTSGSGNVGVGTSAISNVTTANNNIGMGNGVLGAIKTGTQNIGVGPGVLVVSSDNLGAGNNNIGVGANTLFRAGSTSNNIALGSASGNELTSGNGNIFLGGVRGIVNGSNNTIIGNLTGLAANIANTIMIGAGNALRLTIDSLSARFTVPVRMPTYSVAAIPSPVAAGGGAMAYVQDEAGGPVIVFSDGVAWRRCTDSATIS